MYTTLLAIGRDSACRLFVFMKTVLIVIFILFLPLISYASDSIVFCDVGQGDGALIQLEPNTDILIDAGPDASILSCLGNHMNMFNTTIELAIISHADSDHYAGFNSVMSRYKIRQAIIPVIDNDAESYRELTSNLKSKKVPVSTLYAHDRLHIGEATFTFLFPSESAVQDCLPDQRNKCSYIVDFTLRGFTVLFTGDTEPAILDSLTSTQISEIEALKIPHHGSRNGLTEDFLKKVNPLVSIISSGKDNRYGHPHAQILTMLENYKYLRTDQKGAIVLTIP